MNDEFSHSLAVELTVPAVLFRCIQFIFSADRTREGRKKEAGIIPANLFRLFRPREIGDADTDAVENGEGHHQQELRNQIGWR
jgi:uncharacterized protein YcaQ